MTDICYLFLFLKLIVTELDLLWQQVDAKKFGMLANWQRESTMEHILTQLRKEMTTAQNRKLPQPPEGTYFY